MNKILVFGSLAFLGVVLLACARRPGTETAPQPAKPIDAARFFVGRWYEIARTPMAITKGCVAGTTDYHRDSKGRLIDRDACRDKTPEGKEKVFAGHVKLLNSGENTKFSVRYKILGVIPVPVTYWVLDHGDDYSWFIVSDPSFKTLSIFTRAARPSAEDVQKLALRARALGYDTAKLEYPAQFPVGEGQAPAAS